MTNVENIKIEFELKCTQNPKDLAFNALISLLNEYRFILDQEMKITEDIEAQNIMLDKAKTLIDFLKVEVKEI